MCILRESLRRVGGSNNNNNFCQQTLYSKSFCYCLSLFDLHQFLLLLLFFKGTTEQDSCSDRERLSSHQNRNDANKNINRHETTHLREDVKRVAVSFKSQ